MSENQEVPRWLGTTLIHQALDAEGAHDIVQAVTVEGQPKDVGQHYFSQVYRLRATVTRYQTAYITETRDEEECEEREVSLIAKTLPCSHLARATVEGGGFFRVERRALTQVLPSLHAAAQATVAAGKKQEEEKCQPMEALTREKSWDPLWARCLLDGDNPEEFIVMKDLTADGYRVAEAARGLGLRHCLLALRALARFHAVSRLKLEGTDSDMAPLLSLSNTLMDAREEFEKSIELEFLVAGKEIAQWPDFPSHYGERISALAAGALQRFLDANEMKPNAFNVLAHGDFWANNLLFRYDVNGHPYKMLAVDWQMTHVGLPAIDLLYFMYTSLSENVWDNHWDLLLREYHLELTNSLTALGCVRKPSLHELQTQMGRDQSGAWAVFVCVHILPLVKNPRCDYDPGRSAQEQAHIYRSPPYQRAMRRALPKLFEDGLLEP